MKLMDRYRRWRSEEPDGIGDGIAFTNRLATISVRDFSNEAGIDRPVQCDNSRHMPDMIFGITGGIDVA